MESLTHIRSLYGILILKYKHKIIKRLRNSDAVPTLHGDQIWQSSFMVMEYLEQFPLPEGQSIMDIGCGWGLLGIYCAKNHNSHVHLIDADDRVFPYVEAHTILNKVELKTEHIRFEDLVEKHFTGKDIVFGCDICFWPQLVTQLKRLIELALLSGVKKIILADPGRETFRTLALYCKAHLNAKVLPGRTRNNAKSKGYLLVIENPAVRSAA